MAYQDMWVVVEVLVCDISGLGFVAVLSIPAHVCDGSKSKINKEISHQPGGYTGTGLQNPAHIWGIWNRCTIQERCCLHCSKPCTPCTLVVALVLL